MKIAYTKNTVTQSSSNDIIFDLTSNAIYARGIKFGDTVNSENSTDKKLYLIGATAQGRNSSTYSSSNIYTNGGDTLYTPKLNVSNSLTVNGDIIANSLKRWDGTTSNANPIIHAESNNTDINLLRVSYSTTGQYATNAAYGFTLKYIGTGGANANYLRMYADNKNAPSQVLAWSIDQLGNVGIGGDNDNAYKLYVNGTLGVTNNILPLTNGGANIGATTERWATGYFSRALNIGEVNSGIATGSENTYIGVGFVELSGGTPFIDFHYKNSTNDYTNRIIEGLSGELTVTGKLRIGLSYTTPTNYNFHVAGSAYVSTSITTEGSISAQGNNFYTNNSGVYWTSDKKFKKNIQCPVKSGLLEDETGFIRKFDWKDTGKTSYGYIAQELLKQIPEAVDYDAEMNKYSVNYDVAHSAAIAQLVIKIKELESEIKSLKQLIN